MTRPAMFRVIDWLAWHRTPVLALWGLLIAAGVSSSLLDWPPLVAAEAPAPEPLVVAGCQDEGWLPDPVVRYRCPVGLQFAVHDTGSGPVFMCLCPTPTPPETP